MQSPELEMFERSVRAAVSDHDGLDLDDALSRMGWPDALVDDPGAAVSVLFGALGNDRRSCSALDRVLAGRAGADPGPHTAVALPALGRWDPPGRLSADGITVEGLGTSGLVRADQVLVAVAPGPGAPSGFVLVPRPDLTVRPVGGIDPGSGLVSVTASDARCAPLVGPGPAAWREAVAVARLAIGHEMVGAGRAMLELARGHALDRIQFGQPIARFQAVRHRLAETFVAIEGAESLLSAAWEDPSVPVAAAAKAVAGRAAATAARHCQQVLAGIGFTAEHPFHLYFKRTVLLDQLFGTSRAAARQLGAAVLRENRVPGLLPL